MMLWTVVEHPTSILWRTKKRIKSFSKRLPLAHFYLNSVLTRNRKIEMAFKLVMMVVCRLSLRVKKTIGMIQILLMKVIKVIWRSNRYRKQLKIKSNINSSKVTYILTQSWTIKSNSYLSLTKLSPTSPWIRTNYIRLNLIILGIARAKLSWINFSKNLLDKWDGKLK